MIGRTKPEISVTPPRRDRNCEARVTDPYLLKRKPPGTSVCPDCGVLFLKGRWQWGQAPDQAATHRCPACQRTQDQVPAGVLVATGAFLAAHRQEILHLIRNQEARAKAERPLERIMDVRFEEGSLVVRYTDAHLARGTGDALRKAYQGELAFSHTDKDDVLRINWQR